MPSTQQVIESNNYRQLEDKYTRLKTDKDHRRAFHEYLSKAFIRDVDKPETYGQLEKAYLDFR